MASSFNFYSRNYAAHFSPSLKLAVVYVSYSRHGRRNRGYHPTVMIIIFINKDENHLHTISITRSCQPCFKESRDRLTLDKVVQAEYIENNETDNHYQLTGVIM